jgi:excisionase family DNA binding protein
MTELQAPFKLYTITEVAKTLRLTNRTVWNYVKAGKLKAKKVGGKWIISEEDLKKFIGE